MKNVSYKSRRVNTAFTLAEVISALTIGSMVLVAVFGIYSRAERAALAVNNKLDNMQLPNEVLQKIAEDLDGIIASNSDTKIVIQNKLDNLYRTARMEITKTIYGSGKKPITFEKIIWQSSYNYDSWAEGLVLYRSHSGIVTEDKLFSEERDDWEKEYSFVPICEGVTFFQIQVPKGVDENKDEVFLDQWSSKALPKGVTITLSFAESFKAIDGTFDVYEEEKITRTMAIDRSRKIKFNFVKKEFDQEQESEDPNNNEDTESEQGQDPNNKEE